MHFRASYVTGSCVIGTYDTARHSGTLQPINFVLSLRFPLAVNGLQRRIRTTPDNTSQWFCDTPALPEAAHVEKADGQNH